MTKLYFALLAMLLAGTVPARAAEPFGLWATEDGESKIKITPCGPKLCGTLAWLKEPNDAAGKPLNHPANLVAVYSGLAEFLGEKVEPLAGRVEENFRRVFGGLKGSPSK